VRGALDVHRELLARDVPHEVVRLPSRIATADDLPAALGLARGCVAVRCYLVERSGRCAFAAVLVPAGAVPAPEALLDALSARSVRPARPEQVNATTDCTAGLVCPVGLPPDVEVLADAALEQSPTSYCALGEGGVALGIRTPDLLQAVGARTAVLTGAATTVELTGRTIELDPPRGVRPAP
jgi:prolyl-tRNA editing enzyme YbaK/EbsC (Cys-tRNA(Pro) deacylase)